MEKDRRGNFVLEKEALILPDEFDFMFSFTIEFHEEFHRPQVERFIVGLSNSSHQTALKDINNFLTLGKRAEILEGVEKCNPFVLVHAF